MKKDCRVDDTAVLEIYTPRGLFHGHPVFDQLDNRLVYRCLFLFECGNERLIVEEDRLQRIVYRTEIEQGLEVYVGTVEQDVQNVNGSGIAGSFSL